MANSKAKRANIYFRQTARSFKAAKQTQVFSHINRNLPYRIFSLTKDVFAERIRRLNSLVNRNKSKFIKANQKESWDKKR